MKIEIKSKLVDVYTLEPIIINEGEIEINYKIELFKIVNSKKKPTFEVVLLKGEFFRVINTLTAFENLQNENTSDEYFYVEDHEVDYSLSDDSNPEIVILDVLTAIDKYIEKITAISQ